MVPSFEACALRYFDQWFCLEKGFYKNLNKPESERELKLRALFDAAKFFKISRNFPRKFDVQQGKDRLQPALEALEATRRPAKDPDMIEAVNSLADELSQKYGGKKMLSASSKLLWLRCRDPLVIFDNRANTALEVADDTYAVYVAAWRKRFLREKDHVEAACKKLPEVLKFALCGNQMTESSDRDVISQPWFHHRVFDSYLWHKGGPVQSWLP